MKAKPVHKMTSTHASSVGRVAVACSLYTMSWAVLHSWHWRYVTCKRCLAKKPKGHK